MLLPLFAFAYSFFSPVSENKGYENVLIPTNPVPYAARLTGHALEPCSRIRMEDLLFASEMVMDRWRLAQTANRTSTSFTPLDYNSKLVTRYPASGIGLRGIAYTYPASVIQMPQPSQGFSPSSLCGYLFKMYCATNFMHWIPGQSGANWSGRSLAVYPGEGGGDAQMNLALSRAVPTQLVTLPSANNTTPGWSFVYHILAPSLAYDYESYAALTSRIAGLSYAIDDLDAICQYANELRYFTFSAMDGSSQGFSVSNLVKTTSYRSYSKIYNAFDGWQISNPDPTSTTEDILYGVPSYSASAHVASWQVWTWENNNNQPVYKGDGENRTLSLVDAASTLPTVVSSFPLFPEWVYEKVNFLKAYGLYKVTRTWYEALEQKEHEVQVYEDSQTNAYAVLPLTFSFIGLRGPDPTNRVAWYGAKIDMIAAAQATASMDAKQFTPSWDYPEIPSAPGRIEDGLMNPLRWIDYGLEIKLLDVVGVIGVRFKSILPSQNEEEP